MAEENQGFLGKYLPHILSMLGATPALGTLLLGKGNYLGNVNRNRQFLHEIFNEKNNKVGNLNLYENPRDNILHIGEMTTTLPSTLPTQHPARWANPHSQALGYSDMRDLVRQLQQQYPYATRLTGTKIGGAHAFNTPLDQPMQPIKGFVKLPQTEEQLINNEYLESVRNDPTNPFSTTKP